MAKLRYAAMYNSDQRRSADAYFWYQEGGKTFLLFGIRADSEETRYHPGAGLLWPVGGWFQKEDGFLSKTIIREIREEFGGSFADMLSEDQVGDGTFVIQESPKYKNPDKAFFPDEDLVPDTISFASNNYAIEINPEWVGLIACDPKAFDGIQSIVLEDYLKLPPEKSGILASYQGLVRRLMKMGLIPESKN